MSAARPVLTLLAALTILAGCGPPSGGDGPSGAVPGDDPVLRPAPAALLTVNFDDGEGDKREASLSCAAGTDKATGYLRLSDVPDLCRRLSELKGSLTSPPARGRVCAEVFGGPAKARISGRIDGRRVDRRLARTDACEISDWDRVDVLLPDVD